MKKAIIRFKKEVKNLVKDESGQGTTEYILILVAVVAIAAMFSGRIRQAVGEKVQNLASQITSFGG